MASFKRAAGQAMDAISGDMGQLYYLNTSHGTGLAPIASACIIITWLGASKEAQRFQLRAP
jgi:hypothetical protein